MATKNNLRGDMESAASAPCTITDVDTMLRAGLVKATTEQNFTLLATAHSRGGLPLVYREDEAVLKLQDRLARAEELSSAEYDVLIRFVTNESVIEAYKKAIHILVRLRKIMPVVDGVDHASHENGGPSLKPLEKRLRELKLAAKAREERTSQT